MLELGIQPSLGLVESEFEPADIASREHLSRSERQSICMEIYDKMRTYRGDLDIAWCFLMDPPARWCPLPTKAAWGQEQEAHFREPEKLKHERLRQQNEWHITDKAQDFSRKVGFFAVHKPCLVVGLSKLDMAAARAGMGVLKSGKTKEVRFDDVYTASKLR